MFKYVSDSNIAYLEVVGTRAAFQCLFMEMGNVNKIHVQPIGKFERNNIISREFGIEFNLISLQCRVYQYG